MTPCHLAMTPHCLVHAWRTPGNGATPLDACSVTTTACSGDDSNPRDDATPLGACSVTTTPSSETLSNNIKFGNNSTLGNNATLADWPLGDNPKLVVRTLRRDAW